VRVHDQLDGGGVVEVVTFGEDGGDFVEEGFVS
jgi:hypothetical protein